MATSGDWEIGHYVSSGVKSHRPQHRNIVSSTVRRLNTIDSSTTIALIVAPSISIVTKELSASVVEIITQSFFGTSSHEAPLKLRAAFTKVNQYLAGIKGYCSLCCAAAVIVDGTLYVGSCGDLRIFHVRDDALSQVSIVHTMPEFILASDPTSTPEHFMRAPYKHGPLAFLFGEDHFVCDMRMQHTKEFFDASTIHSLALKPDDMIILCSSGVFGDYLIPHDWDLLRQHFCRSDLPVQAVVDGFVSAVRTQPEQYWKTNPTAEDITVLALKWCANG